MVEQARVNELIAKIHDPGSGGTHGREAARAELDALLASDLALGVSQLSADIHRIQKIMGTRVQELTTELGRCREVLAQSSKESSELTSALITWTKRSAVAVVVYTILTGGLLVVALLGLR